MGGLALFLAAVVQVPAGPARPPPWTPPLEVSVRPASGPRATVDIEIRNASPEAIEVPIVATLWLRPPNRGGQSPPPDSSVLFSAFDPVTGAGAGGHGHTDLRLPEGGVSRVRVSLDTLRWSLSPRLYVWVPRPLSQVADYPEYDLTLHILVEGARWASVQSRPVRIRLRSR